MTNASDPALREMAEHRGLKLVKSRRRKPGTGDFGKYGLTDMAGKPLLGIDGDSLTASASDIETYLRSSAQSSWQQSAEAPAPRPLPRKQRRTTREPDKAPSARPSPRKVSPIEKPKPPPAPTPQPASAPKREPVLALRAARAGDADALAMLFSQLDSLTIDAGTIRDNLKPLSGRAAGLIVAEQGALIGCCAWAMISTPHRGPVGRITMLVVDKKHRRRSIATRLLAAAEQALARKGCTLVEAMSDIEVSHMHGFFRSLKFDQTSYRFARAVHQDDGAGTSPPADD
ncbi:GNAT family N-acetyltransferase [Polymorphobacter sp.]|uniref:GNAT family N-acetyltransferase n=1 Tax=Polymorphobacter sp. TaxID=1909290 RepID=UPI003F6EDDDF